MKTKHLFLCLAIEVSACGIANAQSSHYEKTLRERNITADSDGLNEYLRGLHPNEAQRQRAAALIVQLGSGDSFAAREDAMAKLLVLPVLPNEALIAASNGPDAEIRWRAKRILKLGKPESERVLFAAFKTIEEKKIAGVADELLRSILLCDKAHLRYAARRALVAATRSNDSDVIERGLKDENAEVRVSAAAASGKAKNAGWKPNTMTVPKSPANQREMVA